MPCSGMLVTIYILPGNGFKLGSNVPSAENDETPADAFRASSRGFSGADDLDRTGDLNLGKVALYQLSHIRMWNGKSSSLTPGPDIRLSRWRSVGRFGAHRLAIGHIRERHAVGFIRLVDVDVDVAAGGRRPISHQFCDSTRDRQRVGTGDGSVARLMLCVGRMLRAQVVERRHPRLALRELVIDLGDVAPSSNRASMCWSHLVKIAPHLCRLLFAPGAVVHALEWGEELTFGLGLPHEPDGQDSERKSDRPQSHHNGIDRVGFRCASRRHSGNQVSQHLDVHQQRVCQVGTRIAKLA